MSNSPTWLITAVTMTLGCVNHDKASIFQTLAMVGFQILQVIENISYVMSLYASNMRGIVSINTLRPWQNGRHFADDTFKPIFLNENIQISIKTSLKFVSKVPINNVPALIQIMAWRRPGDKPLSQQMMVCLLTHICVTRLQWVKHERNWKY